MLGLLLYPLTAAFGLVLSAYAWDKLPARAHTPSKRQQNAIFFGCLVGAAVGAKLGYLVAEGAWVASQTTLPLATRASMLLTGKTVVGALLGAYAGVEYAKRRVGYGYPTGDTFALLAPCSLVLSRVGCWVQGCCLGRPIRASVFALEDRAGVARWPAVPIELAFNAGFAVFVVLVFASRRKRGHAWLDGQLFHVYLIAYGGFRFAHEFMRDTPRWTGPWSGYHVLALALVCLGSWGFAQRRRRSPR